VGYEGCLITFGLSGHPTSSAGQAPDNDGVNSRGNPQKRLSLYLLNNLYWVVVDLVCIVYNKFPTPEIQ